MAKYVTQMVKNLPAVEETLGQGQEDPLEKKMATHSSTLACKIPWMEKHGGLQFIPQSWTRLIDFTFTSFHVFSKFHLGIYF